MGVYVESGGSVTRLGPINFEAQKKGITDKGPQGYTDSTRDLMETLGTAVPFTYIYVVVTRPFFPLGKPRSFDMLPDYL